MKITETLNNWIEFWIMENPSLLNELPKSLYQWVEKQWSQNMIAIPKDFINELEEIVSAYLRIMWLDSCLYPARVDLWIWRNGRLIIYEITTWFIDQVGSLLALQETLGNQQSGEVISNTPYESSLLSSEPYRSEYELMRWYFSQYWKPLYDSPEWKKVFLYGYPTQDMRNKDNLYPSWEWLEAEQKMTQASVLGILCRDSSFILPRYFNIQDSPYESLPDENYTGLIFKQIEPKLKGERNSILFGKWKLARQRYEFWDMLAQEYIPAFRDTEGKRFEMKALFMPNITGTKLLGLYNLTDWKKESDNFGNTKIPNDWYPQGAVIINT